MHLTFPRSITHCLFMLCLLFITPVSFASAEREAESILVWGDSLSAAYGIPVQQGWVSLLQDKLDKLDEKGFKVINGSISGETTSGGLSRLPNALQQFEPDYVLLELGANDGLRGLNPNIMRQNLQSMLDLIQATEAQAVLIGIKLPPNYGPAYNRLFESVFSDLATQYNLAFVPFLLKGVAEDFALMQEDGLHPTAAAQPLILQHLWPTLETVFFEAETATETSTD